MKERTKEQWRHCRRVLPTRPTRKRRKHLTESGLWEHVSVGAKERHMCRFNHGRTDLGGNRRIVKSTVALTRCWVATCMPSFVHPTNICGLCFGPKERGKNDIWLLIVRRCVCVCVLLGKPLANNCSLQ